MVNLQKFHQIICFKASFLVLVLLDLVTWLQILNKRVVCRRFTCKSLLGYVISCNKIRKARLIREVSRPAMSNLFPKMKSSMNNQEGSHLNKKLMFLCSVSGLGFSSSLKHPSYSTGHIRFRGITISSFTRNCSAYRELLIWISTSLAGGCGGEEAQD